MITIRFIKAALQPAAVLDGLHASAALSLSDTIVNSDSSSPGSSGQPAFKDAGPATLTGSRISVLPSCAVCYGLCLWSGLWDDLVAPG